MDFGVQLRTMRAVRGVSQLELARVVEIPNYHISLFESGNMLPSPGIVDRLRIALRWDQQADEGLRLLGDGDGATGTQMNADSADGLA